MKDTIKLLWTIYRKKRALAEINIAIDDVKLNIVEALLMLEEYHQFRAGILNSHLRRAFTRRCTIQQIKVDELQSAFSELSVARMCLEIQISEMINALHLLRRIHNL